MSPRALRLLLALCLFCLTPWLHAASPPSPEIPAAAQAAPLDPVAATNAWLATVPAAQRAKTDAYFEGGYWLRGWEALVGIASALLLMVAGVSRRLRDAVERRTRRRPLQVVLYAVAALALLWLLGLPLEIYSGYFREHQYGLSNQDFGAWFGEALIDLALTLLLGAAALLGIYAVIDRAPRTWWLWGACLTIAFTLFGSFIYPPFIAPLFNRYEPVQDARVRTEVLSLARAHGVPAEEVYEFNASKQHKRISANVAGFGGTMRIALNDNLLNRASLPEVRMVMAHEIGHYVLNHGLKATMFQVPLFVAMFAFAGRVLASVRTRWALRDAADVAGFPVLLAAFMAFQFVASPLFLNITRMQEIEADRFGLAASREPDAFAAVALKLGEYRKLEPGPMEEWLFYSHPSGRRRVEMAMRFKAEMQREGPAPTAAATAPGR